MAEKRAITKKQIQLIHVLKQDVNMDDETYRAMLAEYGVNSSKDLEYKGACDIIETLVAAGGVLQNRFREGMITPKQMGLVKHLWKSNPKVRYKDVIALDNFVKRILGIDRLFWVPRNQVNKIIKAINNIK